MFLQKYNKSSSIENELNEKWKYLFPLSIGI